MRLAARHPGRLGHDHLPRRHDLDRHERARRRRPARSPVADDTAFAVGSVSKTYTAALILSLAGDGTIDLDAPAATLPARDAASTQRITVRMLLDHTSGLDDFFLHASIDKALQAEPAAAWSVEPDAAVRRASRTSRRARASTTRTRTTSISG